MWQWAWIANINIKPSYTCPLCWCFSGFTYFYKGKEYWKFNNHRLRVEPGYPRSILKDFMGCDLTPIDPDLQPTDDEDVVIKLDNEASTVKAIAIVIPCVLALCLLVLIYTVFQFKRKGTPRHILYCKRSMQEWVWVRQPLDTVV